MTLALIGFLLVFLFGLQQQHITHEKHTWSAVTSYLLAAAQVLLIKEAVVSDWLGIFWLGTGGAIGASASILVHKRLRALFAPRRRARKRSGLLPVWAMPAIPTLDAAVQKHLRATTSPTSPRTKRKGQR